MIFIAILLSLLLTPLIRRLAFKIGAVDKPNERKVHEGVMPRLGGLAIFLSFIITVLFYVDITNEVKGLIIANIIIILIGCLDDTYSISPKAKLIGQFMAASILVGFGYVIHFIDFPFTENLLVFNNMDVPITIFWVVGITNAINLIDGLDGLAAGTSAIAAATIAIVALMNGRIEAFMLASILAASTLGFLRYNFNPAKIFMGDTGSLFLGFNLAALSVLGVTKSVTIISLLLPVLILGIPILDTLWAILRRASTGKPIFQADKKHLHHRLLHMGLTHRQTVLVIYGADIFLGISAILIQTLGSTVSLITFFVLLLFMLILAWRLGTLTDF